MEIDVKDECIKITVRDDTLKSYQKLQLSSFWGLSKDQDGYLSSNPESLEDIVSYLNSEGITHTLSPSAEGLVLKAQSKRGAYLSRVGVASSFKNGDFDDIKFEEFNNLLGEIIQRKLKIHQIKAAYHLNLVGNGANFSVPGSGKTSVVLAHFQKLRSEGKTNTLFVIGPPACFYPWKNEYAAVIGNQPKVKILAGLQKEARLISYSPYNLNDLYLTTFQTLLNDAESIKGFLSEPSVEALVVIDEAHYIKRLDGNWAKAALHIADAATHRCVLTGTPIPRSYMDLLNLWSSFGPVKARFNPMTRPD